MTLFNQSPNEGLTDEYPTPPHIIRPLADAIGGFDLDPASGAEDKPHAEEVYTSEDDGLHNPWFGNVWCNPPYSTKDEWLRKALTEKNNYDTCVMLLPVDTSTGWFHDYVTQASAIVFVKGRIRFDGESPNFGQMFVVYGDTPKELLEALETHGVVFRSPWESTEQLTL